MILSLNGIIAGKGADADALAFITAAGITDSTQKSAITQLVSDLKSANVWNKMKAIYPFVGGTASSHKFNLKDPRDLDVAYRLVFNGGGTHSANGYQPNGTTGYANTFLNPYNVFGDGNPLLPTNSTHQLVHISKYSRTNSTITDNFDGVYTGGYPNSCWLGMGWNSGWSPTGFGIVNTRSAIGSSVTLGTRTDGFFVVNRDGYTSLKSFRNSTLVSTNSVDAREYNEINQQLNLNPQNVYLIGALNTAYDFTFRPLSYNNHETAFQSIGTSLSDSEATALYNAVQTFQTTLGRQVGVPIVADSDAQAFLNAAVITDTTQANAVNTLVTDLKSANIWSKMKAIYPFVGGTASSHKFNLKDPRDLDAAYRLVFNGGWTHSSTGALPNGTNGYADTKLVPSVVQTLNSNGMGMYLGTLNTSTNIDPVHMGVYQSNSQASSLLVNKANTNIGSRLNGSYLSSSTIDALGLISSHRTSSTLTTIYKNSTNVGSGNSGGSLPTIKIALGNVSANSSAFILYDSGWTNSEFRLSYISDGLDSTDMTNFYTAVQTFQTTLGRQV